VIDGRHTRVAGGPKENGFRPAVDPLFRTAAMAFGARTIGVVVSGALSDGTLGLAEIKKAGGRAIVQRPDDAAAESMPMSALRAVDVDYVLTSDQIGERLVNLVARFQDGHPTRGVRGQDAAEAGTPPMHDVEALAPLTVYTCPDCGGTLREATRNGIRRFECHVGHAFNEDAFVQGQSDEVERALWTALRIVQEGVALRERLRDEARNRGLGSLSTEYDVQHRDLSQRAAVLRQALNLSVPDETARPQALWTPSQVVTEADDSQDTTRTGNGHQEAPRAQSAAFPSGSGSHRKRARPARSRRRPTKRD
jgi:two-component system chemotaxis response regulator CheB